MAKVDTKEAFGRKQSFLWKMAKSISVNKQRHVVTEIKRKTEKENLTCWNSTITWGYKASPKGQTLCETSQ